MRRIVAPAAQAAGDGEDGPDLETATQMIAEQLGPVEPVSQMGDELLDEEEVSQRVMEMVEVGLSLATWMAARTRRRLFLVRCKSDGELFFRTSGPGGYGGTSTWKGRCPAGHKETDGVMIGELT